MTRINWQAVTEFERNHAEGIMRHNFPESRKEGNEMKLGDVSGAAGDSLGVALTGDKAGLWIDRATGESGKLRNLIATARGISDQDVVDEYERTFGVSFRENGTNGEKPRRNRDRGTREPDIKPLLEPFKAWPTFVAGVTPDRAKELCGWRGWSPEYVARLVASKQIGWDKGSWAFPVTVDGVVVAAHHRKDDDGKVRWPYEPTGIGVRPFVRGDLAAAGIVHAFESTWDMLTLDDRLAADQTDGVALVGTRGSGNAKLLTCIPFSVREIILWPQNDQAGEKWLADAIAVLAGRNVRVARTPKPHKDLNEWTQSGAASRDLLTAVTEAESPAGPSTGNENTPPPDEADTFAWLKPKLVSELTTVQPDQILQGILYAGCKLILMGGSKTFKTWTLMDLAYCVANGFLWWQTHTKQRPVIYLDFELLDYDFRWRMEQICAAHGKGSIDKVKRIGLKGKSLGETTWPKIHEYIMAEEAGLVVCDPTNFSASFTTKIPHATSPR
jgi:AAA domain/Toprim-like